MNEEFPQTAVICLHNDVLDSAGHIGTCKLCGQQRYYDSDGKGGLRVIKRGRIDGILTEVKPPNKKEALQRLNDLSKASMVPEPAVIKEEKPMVESKSTPPVEEHPAPRRHKKIVRLRREYFEAHKDEIIADYYSITPIREFLSKHHISSKYWMVLKVDWDIAPKRNPRAASRAEKKAEKRDSPPSLPPFNNGWISIVQIEWFQTYKELKLAGKL